MKPVILFAVTSLALAAATPTLACGTDCGERAGAAEHAQRDAGAMRAGGPKLAAIAPLSYSRPALRTATKADAQGRKTACVTAACLTAGQ